MVPYLDLLLSHQLQNSVVVSTLGNFKGPSLGWNNVPSAQISFFFFGKELIMYRSTCVLSGFLVTLMMRHWPVSFYFVRQTNKPLDLGGDLNDVFGITLMMILDTLKKTNSLVKCMVISGHASYQHTLTKITLLQQ